MKNGRKRWRLLIFIFSGFIVALAGYIVILHILIPKKLQQQLLQISPALEIHYSAIHTSLFASAVTLSDVDIHFTPDSTKKKNSHHLHFSKVRLKEINFIRLAASKNFSAGAIELDQADIRLDSALLENNDSVNAKT